MAEGHKSFEFAAERKAGEEIAGTFDIREVDFEIRRLADAVPSLLIYKINKAQGAEVIQLVLDFMELALTPDSSKAFADMALGTDGGGGLKLAQIIEVFQHVLGVVAANPTGSPSDSSPAPRKTGSGSRATRRAAE